MGISNLQTHPISLIHCKWPQGVRNYGSTMSFGNTKLLVGINLFKYKNRSLYTIYSGDISDTNLHSFSEQFRHSLSNTAQTHSLQTNKLCPFDTTAAIEPGMLGLPKLSKTV